MSEKISAIKTQLMLIRVIQKLYFSAIFSLSISIPVLAIESNLLVNPGFELGNTDWNFNANRGISAITSGTFFGETARTGNYALFFGTAGRIASADQVISVIPGNTYTVSYYLKGVGGIQNSFRSSFAGVVIQNYVNYAPAFGWTLVTQDIKVSSNSVSLLFEARHDPQLWVVDDVSVFLFQSSGPTAADTQSSMQYQASQLRSAFNTQTVAANFALNYDCTLFDVKGMCISAGGRYTTIDNPGINNSAAVVTLGY